MKNYVWTKSFGERKVWSSTTENVGSGTAVEIERTSALLMSVKVSKGLLYKTEALPDLITADGTSREGKPSQSREN